MKTSDIMARPPLMVDRDTPPKELAELMETAQVHHLPLLDGDRLIGMWVATRSGPLVLLGPERVFETDADTDASEALVALLEGYEAVLAREEGHPAGLLTRQDALGIVDKALARGIGRRTTRPVVIRLLGPAASGKSTLLARTIPLMRRCQAGVVRSESTPAPGRSMHEIEGAPVVVEPHADRPAPLARSIALLGDVQVVFVEDREGLPRSAEALPGDFLVLVMPAAHAVEIGDDLLDRADAVVLSKLDTAPTGFDLSLTRSTLKRRASHIEVFGVATGVDDRGLDRWRRWLCERVLPRQH